MRLELSTEEQAERERQRELDELDKRRRQRQELQQAQRNDVTQFEIKQNEQRQMEDYQLQQVHHDALFTRLRSKSRSDRLIQLTRLVSGANLDHKYRFQ